MTQIKQELKFGTQHHLSLIHIIRSAGGQVRIIGGAVRDAILGQAASDVDLATDLLPAEVIELCKQHNIKAIPTGLKHGTITVIYQHETFEITSLRQDMHCDGRHAEVSFTSDFAIDAKRRDFTINALSYCPITGTIYDYCDGWQDLQQQRVRFIGKPEQRIKEDYLRIMRFFRFSGRYAINLDAKGLAACLEFSPFLPRLSGERLKKELDLILAAPIKHIDIVNELQHHQLWHYLLPNAVYLADQFADIRILARQYQSSPAQQLALFYTSLLQQARCNINDLIKLKFSRVQAKQILSLIAMMQLSELELSRKLKRLYISEENYLSYFIWAMVFHSQQKIAQLLRFMQNQKDLVFPVASNDLLALGLQGKSLGKTLTYLQNYWLDSDFSLNKSQLLTKLSDV